MNDNKSLDETAVMNLWKGAFFIKSKLLFFSKG